MILQILYCSPRNTSHFFNALRHGKFLIHGMGKMLENLSATKKGQIFENKHIHLTLLKYTIYVSMYIPNTHLITINLTFGVNTYISRHRYFFLIFSVIITNDVKIIMFMQPVLKYFKPIQI